MRALHTPGHRPEHTSFALVATDRGPEPWAVLSGDTLFVGDVARPDLAVDPGEGARGMFSSLHDTLLTLPGECEVWPGHLGGSLCGGPGMDMKVASTIAYERNHNDLVAETDPDRFVQRATAALAPQPPNFKAIVALNRGPLVTEGVDVSPLTPRQVELLQGRGAMVVDVRTDLQFDEAHIPGAVCNPAVRSGFGTKLAWVADRDGEILLVGRDDADALHAAHLAAAVGITNVGGYLAGGMTSWREEKRPTARVERARGGRPARARRRPAGARRPRAPRVGRGPHPGLGPHALPRRRRDPRRHRPGASRRGDLRLGPARRRGRLAARAPRRRARDPRRRRRRRHVGAQGGPLERASRRRQR